MLCRYAEEGSEAAFAELVRRHVDLVHGAALRRRGGDPHRAGDVAQQAGIVRARFGSTSSAAAPGAIVSRQPLVAAPAGLASTSLAAIGAGAGLLATAFLSLMTAKTAAIAVTAPVVLGLGLYFGLNRDLPAPPPLQSPPHDSPMIAALREDNRALEDEAEKLRAKVAQLSAANTQLEAQLAAPPAAPAVVTQGPTLGLARWEVQKGVLSNLRQIDAARKQHAIEKGRVAGSISEIVGPADYLKTVRTVDGEDYSGLSMDPEKPLTVATPDGIIVTYDPTGATTTRPEVPPLEARVEELAPKIQESVMQAVNAYRAANNGGNPPNKQALLPYFATPQESADFTEFMEAQKVR